MLCPRCHGLMEPIRIEDMGATTTSQSLSAWRCLLCGEVIDAGIAANRIGHHEPTRDRTRPHYPPEARQAKRTRTTR